MAATAEGGERSARGDPRARNAAGDLPGDARECSTQRCRSRPAGARAGAHAEASPIAGLNLEMALTLQHDEQVHYYLPIIPGVAMDRRDFLLTTGVLALAPA